MEKKINNNLYRIKKMNAIELFALQTQIDMTNVQTTLSCYNEFLERIEVECNGQWLPVKEKNKDIYYPNEVENDFDTIKALIKFMFDYLNSVFHKSSK